MSHAVRPHDGERVSSSSSPGLSSPPSQHSPNNTGTPSFSHHHGTLVPSQLGRVKDEDTGPEREKVMEADLAKALPGQNQNQKKPRKKREAKVKNEHEHNRSSTATATDGRESGPKVRRARGTAGPSSSSVGRKKKGSDAHDAKSAPPPVRQTKITDLSRSSLPPSELPLAHSRSHQNGKNEAIANSTEPRPPMISSPRSTSGQNYDPVRSSTTEPRTRSPQVPYHRPVRSPTPPRQRLHTTRYVTTGTPPSIANLIEPSSATHSTANPPPSKRTGDVHEPSSPSSKKPCLAPPAHHRIPPTRTDDMHAEGTRVGSDHAATATDADRGPHRDAASTVAAMVKKSSTSTSTGVSSKSHSPKPARPKEARVVLSSGNGLLSSAMFGGGYDGAGIEKSAPTVVLHVPLDGGNNKYVNFARMAEERYGFNALHPRLAAQQERLARVAAAGAALENAHKGIGIARSGMSGDEMSVDLSENEGGGDDSTMEMGGMGPHEGDGIALGRSGGEVSENGGPAKKVPRKRMMKEDQYDKDDPFVDDTELAWEEQAAASKDGFFVYSGPLVPEGEKPNIERADGTTKRGRGKGRGSGTRGRGAASSRPTPTTRKPRVTKAAKVQMDQERLLREGMAVLAAKPSGYPG